MTNNDVVTKLALDSVSEHVEVFADLPMPLAFTLSGPDGAGAAVTLQLSGTDTVTGAAVVCAGLLAWADTLADVELSVWRYDGGDEAWMSVYACGRLTDDTTVRVFAALAYRPGVELAAGERGGLTRAVLATWAEPEVHP